MKIKGFTTEYMEHHSGCYFGCPANIRHYMLLHECNDLNIKQLFDAFKDPCKATQSVVCDMMWFLEKSAQMTISDRVDFALLMARTLGVNFLGWSDVEIRHLESVENPTIHYRNGRSDVKLEWAICSASKEYFYWQRINDFMLDVQIVLRTYGIDFMLPVIKEFCYGKYDEACKTVG